MAAKKTTAAAKAAAEETKAEEPIIAEETAAAPEAQNPVKEEEKLVKEAAPAKKAAAPAKKPEQKAAQTKVSLILQYGSAEADMGALEEKIKASFVAEGHRAGTIKTLNIYVKPEDYAAYYVINDKFSGRVDLF